MPRSPKFPGCPSRPFGPSHPRECCESWNLSLETSSKKSQEGSSCLSLILLHPWNLGTKKIPCPSPLSPGQMDFGNIPNLTSTAFGGGLRDVFPNFPTQLRASTGLEAVTVGKAVPGVNDSLESELPAGIWQLQLRGVKPEENSGKNTGMGGCKCLFYPVFFFPCCSVYQLYSQLFPGCSRFFCCTEGTWSSIPKKTRDVTKIRDAGLVWFFLFSVPLV